MADPLTTRQGRPRDPEADRVIIEATIALLLEGGFGRLSVRGVAARAGVGKATIYRRWPTKADLLRAALARMRESAEGTDTGDLRTDLKAMLHSSVDHFTTTVAGRLMPQLCAEAQFDPELRDLLHANSRERRGVIVQILERARGHRELRQDIDLELVVDLLIAPIFVRTLVTGAPVSTDATDEAVDLVLAGIRAS